MMRRHDSPFLPAAQKGDVIARHMKTALRARKHRAVRREVWILLVDPAAACKLHILPADRDAMLDVFRISRMQAFALLARNRETLGHRLRVEIKRLLSAHVAACERTLGAQISRRGIPDLIDGVGGPGNAA